MPMPNRYDGKCLNCGKIVREGQGQIRKLVGKWHVLHHPECTRGVDKRAAEQTETANEIDRRPIPAHALKRNRHNGSSDVRVTGSDNVIPKIPAGEFPW